MATNKQLCYIALGSNLNHPIRQITQAIEAISQLDNTTVIAQSSLYKTAPYGPVKQADFINAVIAIKTLSSPQQLLTQLQGIELAQGRTREVHWGPRNLDLDILLYGDLKLSTENLNIPHPELKLRNFVLYPLAEVAPSLILPDGTLLTDLLDQITDDGIDLIQPIFKMPKMENKHKKLTH